MPDSLYALLRAVLTYGNNQIRRWSCYFELKKSHSFATCPEFEIRDN